MLHDLLNMDLGGWHPRNFPNTIALSKQKACGLRGFDAFMFDCLQTGELPEARYEGRDVFVSTEAFRAAAQDRAGAKVTSNAVASLLKHLGCTKTDTRPRGWRLSSIAAMRTVWDKARFLYPWPEVGEWGAEVEVPSDF